MKDYERKIQERAKKEVKNFDTWYKTNELKFVNSKIYPSYYATKKLEKPKLRKGWWFACVSYVLLLTAIAFTFCKTSSINNNIFADENLYFPCTKEANSLYAQNLLLEYEDLLKTEMGISLDFENAKSFYTVVEDNSIYLYGVKFVIKVDQYKYYLTFYFPQRDSSISKNSAYKDLDQKVKTNRYEIEYKVTRQSKENAYLYNMKVNRRNYGTYCYLEVKTTTNKLGNFISAIF